MVWVSEGGARARQGTRANNSRASSLSRSRARLALVEAEGHADRALAGVEEAPRGVRGVEHDLAAAHRDGPREPRLRGLELGPEAERAQRLALRRGLGVVEVVARAEPRARDDLALRAAEEPADLRLPLDDLLLELLRLVLLRVGHRALHRLEPALQALRVDVRRLRPLLLLLLFLLLREFLLALAVRGHELLELILHLVILYMPALLGLHGHRSAADAYRARRRASSTPSSQAPAWTFDARPPARRGRGGRAHPRACRPS